LQTQLNFHQISQLPNRTVWIGDQEMLFFSGTAYLGLSQNEAFQQLVRQGQTEYGSVYGSSRNGNVQLAVYDQAEAKLAHWAGAAAALTLSSGMLAGQAVVRQLMVEGYKFVYSPDVHPAVWHLPVIDIPKMNFEAWAQSVIGQQSLVEKDAKIAIVTNSVNALRGELYDFSFLDKLPDNQTFTIVIDDSHGLGVTGLNGSGIFRQIRQKPNLRLIVTASLAKAMGVAGGVILSDSQTLKAIRSSAYFAGCSPIGPDHLHAYLHADPLYEQAQHKLSQNIQLFISQIADLKLFSYTDNYPVFYTERDDLYDFLTSNNILIYSFAYPKPTDKPNTRIIVSAWHEAEDILKLGQLCRRFVAADVL
jgi:8-amino-7-oxononanoate synthase